MNVWLAKRADTASYWANYHFRSDYIEPGVSGFNSFVAFRTRKDAKAFCDEQKQRYGTDWVAVKYTEVK